MAAAACHPQQVAAGPCVGCGLVLCAGCVSDGARCAACATKVRGRGRWKVLAALLGILAVGGAGAVALGLGRAHPPSAPAPAKGPAVMDTLRRQWEETLAKEPCDRTAAVELTKLLLKTEPRAAIERAEAFLAKCGEDARVRTMKFEAHKRLSEWERALADVSTLIEKDPQDPRYWGWRGVVYERTGDLEHAVSDYRKALVLEPRLTDIPFNLADVYERQGRPCEGIEPLQQSFSRNEGRRGLESMAARIDRLANEGCGMSSETGHATILFVPRGNTVHTNVRLNGKVSARMVVDTGASDVAITRAVADKLGIAVDKLRPEMHNTAAGPRTVRCGFLDEVKLQGLTAKHVKMCVLDADPGHDGLLGQSFLSRYTTTFDGKRGRLELVERK